MSNLVIEPDLLLEINYFSTRSFEHCNCYKNIILPGGTCYQPTRTCDKQASAACLNRAIKYDGLNLRKTHAVLHGNSTLVGKIERQIKATLSKELSQQCKSMLFDRIALGKHIKTKRELDNMYCETFERFGIKEKPFGEQQFQPTKRQNAILHRKLQELNDGKLSAGRAARAGKRICKEGNKRKAKDLRKKKVALEMTQAEIEFEKARLKKLEDEENRKQSNINNIKPKKKGPKTHFRKSKKPGRA